MEKSCVLVVLYAFRNAFIVIILLDPSLNPESAQVGGDYPGTAGEPRKTVSRNQS